MAQDCRQEGIERIVVGGVSQGAAMALYTAFNSEVTLAGAFSLSGWLPVHNKLARLVDAVTPESFPPFFVAHSTKDPVVKIRYGHATRTVLESWGLKVTWKEFPSEGHGVPDICWDDVVSFLEQTVPDDTDHAEL
jgi:predicted esterase